MKAVQILMQAELLEAVDREARRRRSDRSKLVREALARFLEDTNRRALEEQHRRGYQMKPQRRDEISPWQKVQRWPRD